jgi:hypothetical protein
MAGSSGIKPNLICYASLIVTLNAHFDGRAIVPDDSTQLPLPSGTRLRVRVEPINELNAGANNVQVFRPLDIRIDPDLSQSIASDPQ